MAGPSALLHVDVLRGANLRDTDTFSKIDPYVCIEFGESVSVSDTHDEAGKNCVFDWKDVVFSFCLSDNLQKLHFEVYDADLGNQDDIVGSADVPFEEIIKAKGKDHSFNGALKLTAKSKLFGTKKAGELFVQFWWEDVAANTALPPPKLRLIKNINHTAGLVRNIIDGGSFEPVDSFQLRLWDVKSLFNNQLSHWNVKYEAAQKIYGPGVQSATIRQGLTFEHGIMYDHDRRIAGAYSTHMVQGLQALIAQLPTSDKNTTPGHSVRFTYVIMPDGRMNFSITSKKSARDFLSKHALHSCASENVVFAGEFWFDTNSPRFHESHKPALIIDNNSGTFAPPADKLPLLLKTLERNFGTALPILTFDRSDPGLKHYFDVNNID